VCVSHGRLLRAVTNRRWSATPLHSTTVGAHVKTWSDQAPGTTWRDNTQGSVMRRF
jgi:hypothetical protein